MNKDNSEISRRTFVVLTIGSVALAAACGSDDEGKPGSNPGSGGGAGAGGSAGAGGDAGSGNQAPVWTTVPTIQFVQGIASSVSIAEYVSDADGDALTISLNSVPLPAGVTYDQPGKRFVYDGVGAVSTTSGHVLTADDGQG